MYYLLYVCLRITLEVCVCCPHGEFYVSRTIILTHSITRLAKLCLLQGTD